MTTQALQHPDRPDEMIVYDYADELRGWIAGRPVEVTQ